MRTAQEIENAIRHMTGAMRGHEQRGDSTNVKFCETIVSALNWILKKPSAFGETLLRCDSIDKVNRAKPN